MREAKTQMILDRMSLEEKQSRVSLEAMEERGIVIQRYMYWVLCHNEFPHSDRIGNMVLWSTNTKLLSKEEKFECMKEFFNIKEEYIKKGFNLLQSGKGRQSVDFKEHYHIYKDMLA